ncbi:hypothetical protein HBI55_253420 [Parastagonospora nodorum]|nr:hypothetical protein HBI55_253420 [Parastagonospora nodorum]
MSSGVILAKRLSRNVRKSLHGNEMFSYILMTRECGRFLADVRRATKEWKSSFILHDQAFSPCFLSILGQWLLFLRPFHTFVCVPLTPSLPDLRFLNRAKRGRQWVYWSRHAPWCSFDSLNNLNTWSLSTWRQDLFDRSVGTTA